jgi:hypothetical protein
LREVQIGRVRIAFVAWLALDQLEVALKLCPRIAVQVALQGEQGE